jgi:hypothetical protein
MITLRELGEFLWAVATNWATWTTGGLVVALLWLWSTLRQVPISRKIGIVVAVLFLLLAFFKAWQEQKHLAVSAQEELSKRFKPNFSCRFDRWMFAPSGSIPPANPDKPPKSYVFVEVTIGNSGAPSIAGAYRLSLMTGDGKVHRGVGQLFSNMPVIGDEHGVKLYRDDCLFVKQATEPIATGAIRPGWVAFSFSEEMQDLLNKTIMDLSFEDITGEEHHFKQPVNTENNASGPPLYYPGFQFQKGGGSEQVK